MKKPNFNIIDYLIIILVIVAIAFAFIHIATDDSHDVQSSTYDYSSIGKILNKYLDYYLEGKNVNTTVIGVDAITGEDIEINGALVWAGDDVNNHFIGKVIDENGSEYLVGIYSDVPYADIYINQITLETDGSSYNATDITVKPKEISSLSDLSLDINSTYEISTAITSDSINPASYQNAVNTLLNNKVNPLKLSVSTSQLIINRINGNDLLTSSDILGSFTGVTSEITFRVYDCTDADLEYIKANFEVENIRAL